MDIHFTQPDVAQALSLPGRDSSRPLRFVKSAKRRDESRRGRHECLRHIGYVKGMAS